MIEFINSSLVYQIPFYSLLLQLILIIVTTLISYFNWRVYLDNIIYYQWVKELLGLIFITFGGYLLSEWGNAWLILSTFLIVLGYYLFISNFIFFWNYIFVIFNTDQVSEKKKELNEVKINPNVNSYIANYNSNIKDIYIELPNYKYFHGPHSSKGDEPFIGREEVQKKLEGILTESSDTNPGGSYLLTGFRGSGKTSLINKTLNCINNKDQDSKKIFFESHEPKYIDISVSLAKDKLKSIDVLQVIAKGLLEKEIQKSHNKIIIFWLYFLIFFLSLFIITNDNIFNHFFDILYKNLIFSFAENKTIVSKIIVTLRTLFYLTSIIFFVLSIVILRNIALKKERTINYSYEKLRSSISKIKHGFKNYKVNIFRQNVLKNNTLYILIISITLFYSFILIVFPSFTFQFLINIWSIPNNFETVIFQSLCLIIIVLTVFKFKEAFGKTNFTIIRHLKNINKRLHYTDEVNNDYGVSSKKSFFAVNKSQRKTSDTIQFRELEDELIKILKFIRNNSNRRYIFVFDELDKIFPYQNTPLADSQEKNVYGEKMRASQRALAEILNSLKFFLNNAHAKFIFIAGREMYEANMADIANRDFFWGSIFQEVIYVDSFLRDDRTYQKRDITNLIEEYVCQYLMPDETIKKLNLNTQDIKQNLLNYYNFFLKTYHIRIKDKSTPSEEEKIRLKESKKIIYALEDFIVYLTYRSAGLPMKLNKLFEHHLVYTSYNDLVRCKSIDGEDQKVFKENLFKYNNILVKQEGNHDKAKFFLKLDYYAQYEIGFVAQLYKSFLSQNAQILKSLNDKTLVSVSFLMDHFLKYHDVGFSAIDLEHTPELIDSYHSPNLRQFIYELLQYLANKHIRFIKNGFFDYKFYKNVSLELEFISKISDTSAAAFNFTLDESKLIRQHYKQKLIEISKNKNEDSNKKKEKDLTNSAIKATIGDLYYFDKDYYEASLYYFDALEEITEEETNKSNLIRILRYTLKHALILERMKSYRTALATYNKAEKLTLNHFLNNSLIKSQNNKESENTNQLLEFEDESFNNQLLENTFIFIQPFLAKLVVIEKERPNGISQEDVRDNFQLVQRLLRQIKTRNNFFLEFEYYVKLANILYLKNAKKYKNQGQELEDHVLNAGRYYKKALLIITNTCLGRNLKSYVKNKEIIKSFLDEKISFLKNKYSDYIINKIGNCFIKYADFLLSKIDKTTEFDEKIVSRICVKLEFETFDQEFDNQFQQVFAFYTLGLICFKQVGRHKKTVQNYTRILYTLKNYYLCKDISRIPTDKKRQLFEDLKSELFPRLLKETLRIHENSLRRLLFDYKDILNLSDRTDVQGIQDHYNITTQYPEIKEALLAMYELELLMTNDTDFTIEDNPISAYNRINNNWLRIFELNYKVSLLETQEFSEKMLQIPKLKDQIDDLLDYSLNKEKRIHQLDTIMGYINTSENKFKVSFILSDIFFCLTRVIKGLQLFGINHITNHFFLAEAYFKLGNWMFVLDYLTDVDRKTIKDNIKIIAGEDDMMFVNKSYNYELALQHYYRCKNSHNQGQEDYNQLFAKMYQLEDDFNDDIIHYCIATDRYRINTDYVKDKIEYCKNKIDKSTIYTQIDNYFMGESYLRINVSFSTTYAVTLLPESIILKKVSGLNTDDLVQNDDIQILEKDSINIDKTEYEKASNIFTEQKQKEIILKYKDKQYPAFYINKDQEIDYAILQQTPTFYIVQYVSRTSKKKEILLKNPKSLSNWKNDIEIELEGGSYLLFDGSILFKDIKRKDVPKIQLEKGKYNIKTSLIGDENKDFSVIYKLEKQ